MNQKANEHFAESIPPLYQQTSQQVLENLKSSTKGLDEHQVYERLTAYGRNQFDKVKIKPAYLRFAAQFHNILIYILLGSALITLFLEHWIDALVIGAVVIANAIIGFIQEGKAEQAMNAMRQLLSHKASVIRSGERQTISAELLVPGDIVILEAGDRIPADLRLIESYSLQTQEAILTGESMPVLKQTTPLTKTAILADQSCMGFAGTLVSSGQGKGVVTATGMNSEVGKISHLLLDIEVLETPLVQQMKVFARWLTAMILTIAGLILIYGHFVLQYPFDQMFIAVVGLSVAAIPEGLPAVLTITLAIGVRKMAAQNAIVRRLPAIEAVGTIDVICTDKTGTLTSNEMMVATLRTTNHTFQVTGHGYQPDGDIVLNGVHAALQDHHSLALLVRAGCLCNDAKLSNQNGNWIVEGDPMEGALHALGLKTNLSFIEWQRTDTIPFDAGRRYMATLNHDHQHHTAIYVKGAPEQVIAMCSSQTDASGTAQALDTQFWLEQAHQIAATGQRVLALAWLPTDDSHTVLSDDELQGKLSLLGLVGLIDPPKPEAIAAVKECFEAGIQVKMITGDHGATATAIGHQIGLSNSSKVITGAELDQMDQPTLITEIERCNIFARTTPEHKLRLVTTLQSLNHRVAMTGDGVNDAPALKRAHAGIAMGKKGSDVTKESAELVLVDDNFATIVAAIRQGRTVYDNLKKVISWTLPTNAGEAMTIVVALLAGMTLPITPVQILWINLITAITLGIALAFEPTEANTMKRPPRHHKEALLDAHLTWHMVFVAVIFLSAVFGIFNYAIQAGKTIEYAQTMAMNTLVVLEIFHLFFIRNIHGTSINWQAIKGTPIIWFTVITIMLAQLAITYIPLFHSVFHTEAIQLNDGLLIIMIGVIAFAIMELEKQLRLMIRRVNRLV